MRTWLFLLGGLIVWTAHLFGIYAAGEIWGHAPAARIAVAALTAACLAANAGLALAVLRWPARDSFAAWVRSVALMAAGLSATAIVWQGASLLAA